MTHEDYKELVTASALSALEATDARDLSAHLKTCAECRAELEEWETTAAVIALDSRPLEPSPQVRERILTTARAEGRRPATVSKFERPKTKKLSVASYYAIAASVALVALAISLFVLWQHNRATRTEMARLAAEKSQIEKQLARERDLIALMTTPGARMTELTGTNVAPTAHAMMAYDKTGHAMLMAKGLPSAPSGKAYQLWFIVGNKPMPGRVFGLDANGNGSLQDQVPSEALNGAVFAITLEPAGGVQSPTGAIYLSSKT